MGVTLSAENKKMFYIPEGFAHGFLVLSDVAEFCYKCTDVYDPTDVYKRQSQILAAAVNKIGVDPEDSSAALQPEPDRSPCPGPA